MSQSDLSATYRQLARHLERIVHSDVRAPHAVIEDACQSAWCALVKRHGAVPAEHTLSWLATTARREALRMNRDEQREQPLASTSQDEPVTPPLELLAEQRHQLALTGLLPDRQRQVVWLCALGLSYREIAARLGWTERTVERQLSRARCRVRLLAEG